MKLFRNDLVKNLPDCYNKEAGSNNHKLMQLIQYDADNFRSVMRELWDALDMEKAEGYTLNLYGEMVGQKRGYANDEQYMLLVKAKMARNLCGGSYRAIVNCLCMILGCQPSEIYLAETEKPCSVKLMDIPLDTIIAADLSPTNFTNLLKSMLPAGVALEASVFSGTFAFSDSEMEASNDAGFCQNEGDDYGGYLGVLSSDETETILPI